MIGDIEDTDSEDSEKFEYRKRIEDTVRQNRFISRQKIRVLEDNRVLRFRGDSLDSCSMIARKWDNALQDRHS